MWGGGGAGRPSCNRSRPVTFHRKRAPSWGKRRGGGCEIGERGGRAGEGRGSTATRGVDCRRVIKERSRIRSGWRLCMSGLYSSSQWEPDPSPLVRPNAWTLLVSLEPKSLWMGPCRGVAIPTVCPLVM
jgi:hypothetical protein